jgi:hypothetical protein
MSDAVNGTEPVEKDRDLGGPVRPEGFTSLPAASDTETSLPAQGLGHAPTDVAPPRPAEQPAAPPAPVVAAAAVAGLLQPLEQRVRRLEQGVGDLQEQRRREASRPVPVAVPAPVPVALPAPPPVAMLLGADAQRTVRHSEAARAEFEDPTWLLRDLLAEARAVGRMFTDPRYTLSWWGRLGPLILVLAVLTSSWWMPWPFTSAEPTPPAQSQPGQGQAAPAPAPAAQSASSMRSIANKVLDLVLCFLLYKVLNYEARRYRQTAPDLPPALRL